MNSGQMNGTDLMIYKRLVDYCNDLGLTIGASGSDLSLYIESGELMGRFENIRDLANYIYGYETGFSKGKCVERKRK